MVLGIIKGIVMLQFTYWGESRLWNEAVRSWKTRDCLFPQERSAEGVLCFRIIYLHLAARHSRAETARLSVTWLSPRENNMLLGFNVISTRSRWKRGFGAKTYSAIKTLKEERRLRSIRVLRVSKTTKICSHQFHATEGTHGFSVTSIHHLRRQTSLDLWFIVAPARKRFAYGSIDGK